MELSYAFLARAAEQAQDGTMHVFGADFDTIQLPAFPAMAPTFALLISFACRPDELGDVHEVEIQIEDPHGVRSRAAEKQLVVGEGLAETKRRFRASLLIMIGMLFSEAGEYRFMISVDGSVVKTLPLLAVQAALKPAEKVDAER